MNYNIIVNTYEDNNLLWNTSTTGNLDDNILIYSTDNETIKINLKNFTFTKENNETILKITQKMCTLTLKELKNSVTIPLDYLNFKCELPNIVLEYKLISQEKPLKINITIGDEIYDL